MENSRVLMLSLIFDQEPVISLSRGIPLSTTSFAIGASSLPVFRIPSCKNSQRRPQLGNIRMRPRKLFLIAVASLVSAVFAYLGTGLHPIWWALWLAPIPVFAIAPRLHGSVAFLLGAIVWVIGEMNQWNYVRHAINCHRRPPSSTFWFLLWFLAS